VSDFAFFRFLSYNLLTAEEKEHKSEIISITEDVLDAKGIECDAKISQMSEEQTKEILEDVRKIRKKKKKDKALEITIDENV
jgi:hypothetical protein